MNPITEKKNQEFNDRVVAYKKARLECLLKIGNEHFIDERIILARPHNTFFDRILFWFMKMRGIRIAVIYKDINK